MKSDSGNRAEYLRTFQKGEREQIKEILEKAFKKRKNKRKE